MSGFAGTDRFSVVRPLGAGGMGQVFEAFDREQGAPCALKLLPAVTPDRLLRFKQEFRALQGLRHPNLVTLGELVEDGGRWFFTMELVEGVDFLAWVCPGSVDLGDPTVSSVTLTFDDRAPLAVPPRDRTRRPMTPYDPERLRDALVQLAHGLAALHDAGKVHRDVKPSNILVAPDGRVVLLDFGVVSDGTGRPDAGPAGTLAYMAPEQATGAPITAKTDLFAVGVILYRALTGQVPFSDLSLDGVRRRQWFRPRRPRDVSPEVPDLLDELCADLLAPEAEGRPSARELAHRLGAASPPVILDCRIPFVGRQRELTQLEGAWARGTGVVAIGGPSGIGKTALVEEFLLRAEPGPLVLRGRCHEQEGIPFRAVDGVIDALGEALDRDPSLGGDGDERRALGMLFPSLARGDELGPGPPESDLHEQRRSAERALRAVLSRIAATRPLLVVIDDFQWADADSVALLQVVTRPPDAPRFLLLLATRGGDGAPTLTSEADQIALGPLAAAEARSLAETLVGADGADTVVREAAGHPLFLLELARLGPAAQGMVRLEDVLWARVTEVDDDGQRVLALAAVAAAPVAQEILGHAAELPAAALSRAVATLRAAKLARTGGVRREDVLETWHDRIRETVVARLDAEGRREHHRRLAEALLALRPDDAGTLAVHLAAAGDVLGAGEQSLIAGDAARQALAFERAAAHFRRAAEWLPAALVAERRVLPRLAEALADAGLGADAAYAFERAAAVAPPSEAPELLRRAAEHYIRSGRFDQGVDALRTVMQRLGVPLPATSTGAYASLLLGRARLRLRGLGFHQAKAPRSTDLLRVDTLWSAAASLGAIDTIRAADCQSRQLVVALDAGEPFRAARALYGEAIFVATGGPTEADRARSLIRRAEELGARVRHPYTDAMHFFAEGILDYECGRYRAGYRGLDRAGELFRASPGAAHDAAVSNRFALDCLFYLGELGEVTRRVPRLLEDAERRGDLYLAAELKTGLPNIDCLCADDPATARQRTEQGIARWSRRGFHLQHYSHLLALAHIDLYQGDGGGAWRTAMEVAPGLRKSFLIRVQAVRKEATFLRGRAAVAAGELREAERAAASLAAEPVPAATGFATAVRAGIACRRGDRNAARALFAEAARLLVVAEAGMFAAACRRHAAHLDGDVAAVAETDAWMRARAVVRPDRFAAMLVPSGEGV